MNLAYATKLALQIQAELTEFCLPGFCTIAGSIRRGRPEVNDIDLVCVPKDQYALRARILRTNVTPVVDGAVNLIVRLRNGVQLDVFMARPATADLLDKRPTNYGSLLLCRTGSRAHNIKLVERAKELGLKWQPYEGIFQGDTLIASETEHYIFRALQLDYREPKDRE